MRKLSILLLVAALGCGSAKPEVRELYPDEPTCDVKLKACTLQLRIYGMIDQSTLHKFQAIVETTRHEATNQDWFFTLFSVDLNSPGGNVDAAMAIGRIIRKEDSAVVVNQNSQCLSSCVLIVAGGSTRQLGGLVGIHRPYFNVPTGEISGETIAARYRRVLQDIRTYLRDMNVAEKLADDMLRTNPEDIRLLSRADLANDGLTEVDPVAMEIFELEQAQKYGLDRQEYMRRKKLAEAQCGGPASLGTGCYQSILKTGFWQQPDFSKYGVPAPSFR
jgi:hypothetical protein